MRVLIIHNFYQKAGGEDIVFHLESELLESHGHIVECLTFDNKEISSFLDAILVGIQSIYNFKSAKILKEKIKTFKPDIIHVHNFFPIASPSIFYIAKRMKVPIVMTLHNFRLICPSATLFFNGQIYEKSVHSIFPVDAILKGVYRDSKIQTAVLVFMTGIHKLIGTWKNKVDRYIIPTEFARNRILDSSLALTKSKVVAKPNFIKELGHNLIEDREKYFLFVGRLSEEKGIETLLKASQLYDFHLEIIGGGDLKVLVDEYVKKNEKVRYLGFQSREFIIEKMKKTKALIFPSVCYEGQPLTLLEVLSTGTPVIISDIGNLNEIITDKYNGLHFRTGDAEDLANKVKYFQENPNEIQSMYANARATYLAKYTPEKNYEMLIGIYEQVIKESQAN